MRPNKLMIRLIGHVQLERVLRSIALETSPMCLHVCNIWRIHYFLSGEVLNIAVTYL